MLPPSLFAPLIILVASTVTVSAAPGLTVKTSTPNVEVDGLENLKVTTTVINTGGETLKLLNDPRGVLNSFPENTFTITDAAGSRPLFDGAKVQYNPTHAAGLDDPSVFTVLVPGASIGVTHDLSAAYNFTQSGAGDYSIEPSNLFIYVGADGTPKSLYATVEDVAEVKLSGNLAVSRAHDKRASYNSCSASQQAQLITAASNAQAYASSAYSYLRGISSGTPRYTTWFGTYTQHRKDTVQYHFGKISGSKFSSFTYSCTCPDPNSYSYVLPYQFGTVYLCGLFWIVSDTGTDSRAGALVQASSFFTANGGTSDYARGQADCKKLAVSNAGNAIFNADSHEYFAENIPVLS